MKAALIALALLGMLVGGAGAASRPEVCIIVDPVFDVGCNPKPPPPPPPPTAPTQTTGSAPPPRSGAGVPEDTEPVRRSSTVPRYDPRRIAVTFQPDASKDDIRRAIADAGATLDEAVPKIRAYLVGVAPDRMKQAVASFRASPAVARASQELIAEAFDTSPTDDDWPQQDSLRVVGLPKAWDVTRGSSRIVVAVIDTGVDPRQQDLAGALVPGYDFVNGDTNPSDDHGHGTAVAGVIAARANNHLGGAGVCSRCTVMPIKVLDAHGNGDDTLIAAGIVWATDHGAKVINLSLGGPGTSQELTNALAYANGKGVVVVAAAGNAGTTTEFFPAADPRAVSVAATTVSDRRYSWSNFGQWVRLAAPGCNFAPLLSGGYGYFCGTSSAAPVVAGLVALELSAFPSATPQQVEQALAGAAVPLPQIVHHGRIDAARTLALLRPKTPLSAQIAFRGSLGGKVLGRVYRVQAGAGTLSATLRFTRSARLALEVLAPGIVKPLARVEGASPLELAVSTSAGPVVLRVTGATKSKTSYVLRVSYALPASGG
jgi:subtilisin family serine protease